MKKIGLIALSIVGVLVLIGIVTPRKPHYEALATQCLAKQKENCLQLEKLCENKDSTACLYTAAVRYKLGDKEGTVKLIQYSCQLQNQYACQLLGKDHRNTASSNDPAKTMAQMQSIQKTTENYRMMAEIAKVQHDTNMAILRNMGSAYGGGTHYEYRYEYVPKYNY
jgi:hypothetical protein